MSLNVHILSLDSESECGWSLHHNEEVTNQPITSLCSYGSIKELFLVVYNTWPKLIDIFFLKNVSVLIFFGSHYAKMMLYSSIR